MDRQKTHMTTEVNSQTKLEDPLGEPLSKCLRKMGMKKEPWPLHWIKLMVYKPLPFFFVINMHEKPRVSL